MKREINLDSLVHYFAGECTDEEEAEIKAWIQEDPARKKEVEALRQLWQAAGEPSFSPSRDVDKAWETVYKKLESAPPRRVGQEGRPRRAPSRASKKLKTKRERLRRFSQAAMLAAIVAIATFAAVEIFETSPEGSDMSAMREVATEPGQRAHIRLSDGTRVVLNAKSTLELPSEFGTGTREVHLQGEAYFEVVAEEEQPFIVRAGEATARVLGTAFSVGAYSDDEAVQVVVTEGKVSMQSEEASNQEGVVLEPRQMGLLDKRKRQIARREVDPSRYLAWTEGRLVFEDAPFSEVAKKLKRWYDLEVKLDDPTMTVDRLNATFEDEPVSKVLDIIAKTLNLRYEREEDGSVVTFYPSTTDSL